MNVISMSSKSKRHELPEIQSEARAWIIKLDGADICRTEKTELAAWLERSPMHKQVFLETARLWCDLDKVAEYSNKFLADSDNTVSTDSVTSDSGWGFAKFGAYAVLLVLGLSAGLLTWVSKSDTVEYSEYATTVGEVSRVSLSDGSLLTLNTNTSLAVAYYKDARFIHLTSGEAFFEVAHNAERPFLVYVGKYAVTAVGTAFSVETRNNSVEVIVTDGKIEVSTFEEAMSDNTSMNLQKMSKAEALVPLEKGQYGVFNEEVGRLELVQDMEEDIAQQNLSWRDGMLIFDNDTLANVVEKISRYTQTRIVISDSSIRDMRFGGYFKVGDIDAILSTIENDFGIQVEQVGDDLVYLSLAKNTENLQ